MGEIKGVALKVDKGSGEGEWAVGKLKKQRSKKSYQETRSKVEGKKKCNAVYRG